MPKSSDWAPSSRDGQITMCQNWINYMTSERRTAWGIPAAQFTELGLLFDAARTVLQKAKDDTQRTPVVTAQCAEAFAALMDKMRYFKSHFFLIPPWDCGSGLKARTFRPPTPSPPRTSATRTPALSTSSTSAPGRPIPPTPAATTARPSK
jgi:hypothetical protein